MDQRFEHIGCRMTLILPFLKRIHKSWRINHYSQIGCILLIHRSFTQLPFNEPNKRFQENIFFFPEEKERKSDQLKNLIFLTVQSDLFVNKISDGYFESKSVLFLQLLLQILFQSNLHLFLRVWCCQFTGCYILASWAFYHHHYYQHVHDHQIFDEKHTIQRNAQLQSVA